MPSVATVLERDAAELQARSTAGCAQHATVHRCNDGTGATMAPVQADYKDKDCQLNDGDDTFACDALFYGLEWYDSTASLTSCGYAKERLAVEYRADRS